MGKCYCDYCDVFLTHDSVAVRKQHNDGNKHKQNVCDYYRQFIGLKTQRLIDEIVAAFDEKVARGLIQPSYGFPSLNGAAPTREDPAKTSSNEPQPGDTTGIAALPESSAIPNEPDSNSVREVDMEKPVAEIAVFEHSDEMKEENAQSGKTKEISKDALLNANQQQDLEAGNTAAENDQELDVKAEDDDGSDFEFVEVRAS